MGVIKELQRKVHKTAFDHGWWREDRNIGEALALIHSEVSEALEVWREGKALEEVVLSTDGKPEGFFVELADVVIRVLDLAQHYNIDMEVILNMKAAYNETRAYRHGGKLA